MGRNDLFAEDRSMVPSYLKERLLGESGDSLHLGDSARTAESQEYEPVYDTPAGVAGTPYFHRGEPFGNTYRVVEVNRKKWDMLASHSLGRTESCEFSTIEQANLPTLDAAPMALRSLKRKPPITRDFTHPHQSIFGLPVMSPFNKLAKSWLTFIAVVDLTFTAFIVPYITAFLSHGGHLESLFLEIVDIITGIVFLFDLFINFHIGFVISCDYRKKIEMRGKHIAWYYFHHGGAWIDIISVMPSILGIMMLLIGSLVENAPVPLVRYIRMIRIVRLIRALSSTRILNRTENKVFRWIGPTTMYLLSVIYCLVVLVNFLGCLLYFVAVMESEELEDTWISRYGHDATTGSDAFHYLLGVYWAITTVTTVGYGDVVPHTSIELLLMGFVMLTQIVIFGFLIGTMTEIVTNSMTTLRHAEKYKQKMESVENWMMHYNIPENLVDTVKAFYSQVWLRKEDVDEDHILNELPIRIRSSIVYSLLGETLKSLPLFSSLRESTIFKIASKMSPVVKYPDEEISLHRRGSEMLCVLEDGSVSVAASRGLSYKYRAPDMFGAGLVLFFLSSYRPTFGWKLRAYTCCRVWCISITDLFEIIDAHDEGRELLMRGFHQLLLDRLSRWEDERAQEKILGLELGKTLSAAAVAEVKTELSKDRLSVEDLVGILSDRDETTMLERVHNAMDGHPNKDAVDEGSSGSDRDTNSFAVLLGLLRQRGVHGAVEFVQQLMTLGDDSISEDLLKALLEKFGIDVMSIDLHPLKTAKREGGILITDIVSKLLSLQTFSDGASIVKQAFTRLFPEDEADVYSIIDAFDISKHPDVQVGRKSTGTVLREALSVLLKKDVCTQDDFVLYHRLVALCSPSENDFGAYVIDCWNKKP